MSRLRNSFLSLLLISISVIQPVAALESKQLQITEVPRDFMLDGVVEAVNRSTIAAQTGGQITEIDFDVDDYVEKGQVIVRLKDSQQKAALTTAEAQLKQAVTALQDAQDTYDRAAKVFDKGAISEADMDKITAALESAKAAREAAAAGVEQAREQLEYTKVTAPYTGIVTERHVQVGEVAAPGTPLMSGISLEELRVNVDVPQSLIPVIRKQPQGYVIGPDGLPIMAEKITVFPYADQSSNTFRVRLELPETDGGFFPGMYVKTGFIIGMEKLLLVPESAVVNRSEVTGVYVIDEQTGKVSLRYIRTGRRFPDGNVSILSGLSPGETIALDPVEAGVAAKRGNGAKGDE
ncbi:MAG: efflux RND transporter periplasmic adaptor subunit [Gammaproteobacteria bacterium]|jgi:RND family efflux transporter MFP subunit